MDAAMTSGRKFNGNRFFPLLLSTLLFSSTLLAQETPVLLRQPVSQGAYEMVYSQQNNALYLATAQRFKEDKGGVVYRLDPQSLKITQTIHNDFKPFGAAINPSTGTLYFTNTINSALTAIDSNTGDVIGRLVLDARKRTDSFKPLAPREVVLDTATDTLYVGGVGQASAVWVVNGKVLSLRATIEGTGSRAAGLALDAAAHRLFVTNGDGELVSIDTGTNQIVSRQKLDANKEHLFLNIALDPSSHRAFISDAKQPAVLVVDSRNGEIIQRITVPESLAVLFNPIRQELYVTHRQAGTVSVIDAKTYRVLQTIKTPVHPNSLALSPDGQTLYVSVKQESTKDKPATAPDDVVRIAL